MENTDKLHSARALLDPDLHSIEEISAQFEAYKRHRRAEQQEFEKQLRKMNSNADFEELNDNMESLRVGLQELEAKQPELNAIEQATSEESVDSHQNDSDSDAAELVVANGVSQCVYHGCQRMVDSQLLLLHYLCDHNQDDSHCLSLREGEQVVLSFQPQSCAFRVNKVLGLLAYGGRLEPQFGENQRRRKFYNAFLPDEHSHLATHVPVVVLICRTAAQAVLKRDPDEQGERWLSDSPKDAVFVIWLVTPSDRIHLNAKLCLCGRDAAGRVACVIGVRHVNHCQDTARFMAVDTDYFRLTYSKIARLSNDFRDELHLEIGLTEPNS